MATQRFLSRPPVMEALVDLRTSVAQPPEVFQALATELKDQFPKTNLSQTFTTQLNVKEGKIIPQQGEVGFRGVQLHSSDDTLAVQFRVDGFTFNNINHYVGGDSLLEQSLSLWNRFAERVHPGSVNRVALRYINRLELPFRDGDDFTRFLIAPPDLPPGSPQSISEFLSRIVAHEDDRRGHTVITQRLTHEQGRAVVILDIDAVRMGEFSVDLQSLRPVLEELRALKNRVFFSLITEETATLYE